MTWDENQPLTLVVQSRDQRSMQVLEADENTGQTETVLEITDPHWVEICARAVFSTDDNFDRIALSRYRTVAGPL